MKLLNFLLLTLGLSFYSCSKKNKDLDASEDPAGIEMSDSGEFDEFSDDFDEVAEGDFSDEFGDEFGDESFADAGDDFAVDDFSDEEYASDLSEPVDAGDWSDPGEGVADAGDAFADDMDAGAGVAITPTGGEEIYTVQSSDTLMLIAFKLYGDYSRWREIAQLNQDVLAGGTQIRTGMQLRYSGDGAGFSWDPQGNPYLIQYGDTLGLISGKVYGTQQRWRDIWDNNKPLIKDPNRIYAGFTIYYIPDDSREVASGLQDEPVEQAVEQAPVDDGFEDDLSFDDDGFDFDDDF